MGTIPVGALPSGRDAFAREAWSDAASLLARADRETALEPEDLHRLATAAFLLGEDAASSDALTRAHHGLLARGDPIGAARSAIWLALTMFDRPALHPQ